ncbi:hypothetical protein SETIT_9G500000v2 [Setaria italica]|uniref:ASCH domain-containing protein n=1 Tax=Setaria italica TaxID=4555 RepID=K4AC83_SETIT|nr:uncharacterized protein LOC101776483 isoform X1 [Setaria italica]RCV46034.1 hypothetical protein SETIT_9G500000v2 [Setaria italica]
MRGGYSGRGGFGAGRHSSSSNDGRGYHGNPCLTMHQPWASLLVHGIKRVEGRSWPSPITGRLWIHAASKVPDPDTIKAMEDFYREIYAVDGITDIKFPDHFPVSRLLGCVEVVGCLRSEELVCWEDVPQSVRLEGLTDFCWLCENPQKLVVPFEMRGYQGVYNLERRIYDGAVRGLTPVQGPLPIKFPLPDPRDRFSLKPGSLTFDASKSEVQKSSSVTAAIAGARAAATQFSKKDPNAATSSETRVREQSWGNHADSNSGNGNLPSVVQGSPAYLQNQNQPSIFRSTTAYSQNPDTEPRRSPRLEFGASNRLVAVALRELKQLSVSERGGQPAGSGRS